MSKAAGKSTGAGGNGQSSRAGKGSAGKPSTVTNAKSGKFRTNEAPRTGRTPPPTEKTN